MVRGQFTLESHPATCTPGQENMSPGTKQERTPHSWQNTKPLHTRDRRPPTKQRSLPAPGTVSPDRWERQCSSGGVQFQSLMARQSGTSLHYSASRVRLREDEQLRMNVAPVYVVLGQTEWDFSLSTVNYVCNFILVLNYVWYSQILYDSIS